MHNSQLNIAQSVKTSLLFFILLFVLTQCTSRYSQSDADKILSTERVPAKTSPISFQLPQGWRVVDANDSTYSDLWMISDDYNSSLSLIPLNSNNSNRSLSEWFYVSKLSTKMKFKSANITIVDDNDIDINGIRVSAYKFKTEKAFYRISIFQFNENFYELTVLDKNIYKGESAQLKFLKQLQTEILQSVK